MLTELKKRGDGAVKGFIAALRKSKKITCCKLVILGEAGVGKTNLQNLLTEKVCTNINEKL